MKEYIVPVGDKGNIAMIENELHLQELVRCKDCKHMEDDGAISPLIWCSIHEFGRMNDYFCADAILKEGR